MYIIQFKPNLSTITTPIYVFVFPPSFIMELWIIKPDVTICWLPPVTFVFVWRVSLHLFLYPCSVFLIFFPLSPLSTKFYYPFQECTIVHPNVGWNILSSGRRRLLPISSCNLILTFEYVIYHFNKP